MDRQVGHVGRSTTRVVGVPEGQHSKTAHPRCCGGGRDRTGLVNGYRMRGSAGHWDEPGRASHEDRGEHADQGEQDGDAHPQVVARGQCLRGCVVSERASRVATTPDRMAKPISPPICWDVVISPEKCPRTVLWLRRTYARSSCRNRWADQQAGQHVKGVVAVYRQEADPGHADCDQ